MKQQLEARGSPDTTPPVLSSSCGKERGMQANEAMRALFGRGKASAIDASFKIGKKRNYISGTISRGSTPQADTYAMIMDAIGYDLLLRNRETGEEIIIDPPE
jgi:hypothetical protein